MVWKVNTNFASHVTYATCVGTNISTMIAPPLITTCLQFLVQNRILLSTLNWYKKKQTKLHSSLCIMQPTYKYA